MCAFIIYEVEIKSSKVDKKTKNIEIISNKLLTLEIISCKVVTIRIQYQERNGEENMKYSLKELRARLSLTQAEMAEKLGISTQTYNSWENDFSKVKMKDALKIAKLCGISIDEFKF